MAETNEPTGTDAQAEGAQGAQPSVGDLMARVEALTAERDKAIEQSRKWEGRSKSNAEKAKAYDEQNAKAKTLEERIAAIEGENTRLRAERERASLVAGVAKSAGVPDAIVSMLNGEDEEQLAAQVKALREFAAQAKPVGGAPNLPEAGRIDRGATKPTAESIRKNRNARERIALMGKHPELFRK